MVSVLDLALLGVLFGVHTLVAAVMVRFFRIRLTTDAGAAAYSLVFVPVVLLVTTLVFTGLLGLGADLGSGAAVVGLLIGAPLVLGATVDVLYQPDPEEYELPETR
jgi:hypothetical protein